MTDFDSHENKKLTPHEIQLIEYSFFSLCEEVDLFYCEQKEIEVSHEIYFTRESMRERCMAILEALESYPTDSVPWQARLRQMYLLSMGVFKCQDESMNNAEEEKVPEPAGAEEYKTKGDSGGEKVEPPASAASDSAAEETKKEEETKTETEAPSKETEAAEEAGDTQVNTSVEEVKKADNDDVPVEE